MDQHRAHQMTFTLREAVASGLCTKNTYRETEAYVRMTVEQHEAARTPRKQWEPPQVANFQLSQRYARAAREHLARRLERDVEPLLEEIEQGLEPVPGLLDKLAEFPHPITTVESSATYSAGEAIARHDALTERIERDIADGHEHHRRSPTWLKWLGRWAPWAEAVGFLAFVSYYLNVELFNPLGEPLAWTFAMVIVVFIILGQTWLVHHAAREHNIAIEDDADGTRHAAEKARAKRRWYLAGTALAAGAITGGLVARGLASLGAPGLVPTSVLVTLAAATGLLMPTLSFLAKALDGSKISRERDGLADDLDADLEACRALKNTISRRIESTRDSEAALVHRVCPDILVSTQGIFNKVHVPYAWIRVQIGGLAGDSPSKGEPVLARTAWGSMVGRLSCGIPGADHVDLQPFADRGARLDALRRQRSVLTARLGMMPEHPWAIRNGA